MTEEEKNPAEENPFLCPKCRATSQTMYASCPDCGESLYIQCPSCKVTWGFYVRRSFCQCCGQEILEKAESPPLRPGAKSLPGHKEST